MPKRRQVSAALLPWLRCHSSHSSRTRAARLSSRFSPRRANWRASGTHWVCMRSLYPRVSRIILSELTAIPATAINRPYTGGAMPRRSALALGNSLAAVRKERGLTQVELAADAGLGQPLLSDYERGRLRFSAETALRLAAALDVPVERLLAPGAAPLPRRAAPRRRILRRLEQIERLPRNRQAAVPQALDLMLQHPA